MVPSGISDVDLHDTGVSNTSASSGQQGQHALPRVIPDLEHDDVLPKIPSSIDGGVGGRYSVSVAQMRTPGRARSLFNKAIKAVSRKRSAEAFEFLEQALSVHSSFAEAMALRGILKMNEGQQDDARADLERAVQLDAGNSPALITLGEIYNLHARWDDAVRVLERGLSFNPRSWQGHYELGLALLVKNDYVPALMHMTRAEEIRPDYGPLRLLRADALLALRRYSETKSELEAYLQREPDGVYAFETRLALDRMSALTTQARK